MFNLKFLIIIFVVACFLLTGSQTALAALNFGNAPGLLGAGATAAGLQLSDDPIAIAAVIIQAILGLVGIIFFLYFIYGGFKYMTAAGADQKIQDAKKVIIHAIIGLAIVTAAYSIAFFVVSALESESEPSQPYELYD